MQNTIQRVEQLLAEHKRWAQSRPKNCLTNVFVVDANDIEMLLGIAIAGLRTGEINESIVRDVIQGMRFRHSANSTTWEGQADRRRNVMAAA